ncbi:MAG: hypothetical protein ABFS56_18590 [Pseudomonadota bacterium]
MHYEIASNAAQGLAQSAWDNIGHDCTRLNQFIGIVSLGVSDAVNDIGTRYRGRAAEDFGTGYIIGLRAVLGSVALDCVSLGVSDAVYRGRTAEVFGTGYVRAVLALDSMNECQVLGHAMGEWAAKMFCRVAAVIEHTPSFTSRISNVDGGICGRAYRRGCESNFVGVARGMCPTYANGTAFDKYYEGADGGCCGYDPN